MQGANNGVQRFNKIELARTFTEGFERIYQANTRLQQGSQLSDQRRKVLKPNLARLF